MLSFITEIRTKTIKTFEDVDRWFSIPKPVRIYCPNSGGWSINEILEHISLTNHYLLILIEKGTRKALNNINNLNLEIELSSYQNSNPKLDEVMLYKKFDWIRPNHMEPKGISSDEVQRVLKVQLNLILDCIDNMPNGEGILYSTMMTVNNLGKINVYEYIDFLLNHSKRHITQMEICKKEFLDSKINHS